ncbi:MAG: dGTP triphosphohydrolase [Patescibacteria group bacterium]
MQLFSREVIENRECETLAAFAVKSGQSQGRMYATSVDSYRTCFQRDRDRIIHSKAFRRLQAKTQVFVSSEGDHYRNRMIHSVECAQISRGLCRTFGLNEDLGEAIALAHDLGHTPFGHAGEAAMNEILQGFDLHFEHNEQSLRVVEKLEKISPDFEGLNLTKEVLDGMLKHHTPFDRPKMKFVYSAHLEGQVVDLGDEIAYMSADIDDGLRSEVFSFEDLRGVPLMREILERVSHGYDLGIFDETLRARVSNALMRAMVEDVSTESQKRLLENKILTLEDVQKYPAVLISFSPDFRIALDLVRKFLLENFYHSPRVKAQTDHGQSIIRDLFSAFLKDPSKLPERARVMMADGERIEVVVKDYVAGMTDTFAERMWSEM